MSDEHSLRRLPLLVIALLLLVAFTSCISATRPLPPSNQGTAHLTDEGLLAGAGTACAGGARNSNYAPLICVNDSPSAPVVSPASAHVVKETKNHQPVVVNWFTSSGTNTLELEAKPGSALSACFSYVRCNGPHCVGVMLRSAAAGTQCEYYAKVNGVRSADPVIIVDDCCPPPTALDTSTP